MALTLRVVLLAASILTSIWVVMRIRKAQIRIEDSVFWILFSFVLILMSIFPGVIELGARITGVQSPVNFVFLTIIFVLLIKMFRMSIKISQLENKLQRFAQTYALHNVMEKQAKETEEQNLIRENHC